MRQGGRVDCENAIEHNTGAMKAFFPFSTCDRGSVGGCPGPMDEEPLDHAAKARHIIREIPEKRLQVFDIREDARLTVEIKGFFFAGMCHDSLSKGRLPYWADGGKTDVPS
jgi:hypothetical protein